MAKQGSTSDTSIGDSIAINDMTITSTTPDSNGHNVKFHFDAFLNTGPLTGTFFDGTGSYNSTGETGMGEEFLNLTSLNFKLLGTKFTHADIYQGGQAVLENGILVDFTAAMLAPSSNSPVTQIVFGFGPPNQVFYETPGSEIIGSGVFLPEPRGTTTSNHVHLWQDAAT
jgi:hypothetical protein